MNTNTDTDIKPAHPAAELGVSPDVYLLAREAVAAALRQQDKAQHRVVAAGRDLEEAKAAVKSAVSYAEYAGVPAEHLPTRGVQR